MKKQVVSAAMVLVLGVCAMLPVTKSDAAQKWNRENKIMVEKDGVKYEAYLSEDGTESWIEYAVLPSGLKALNFPKKINGAPVTRIGVGEEAYAEECTDWYYNLFGETLEPWHGVYGEDGKMARKMRTIEKIKLPETVTQIETGCFSGMEGVKKIVIPNGMKELKDYIFSHCTSLKKVVLPESLETFNKDALEMSENISSISISKKNKKYTTEKNMLLENKKKLIWVAPTLKEIEPPKGVTTLGEKVLRDSKAKKVIITKKISKIEYGALSGSHIKKVVLKKGNKVYALDKGCIYTKKTRMLVAVTEKYNAVKITSKVNKIGPSVSVMGDWIARVDIPKTIKKVLGTWHFWGNNVKIYFHGKKPPQIVPGEYTDYVPTENPVFVPKKSKKAYKEWAKKYAGIEEGKGKFEKLHVF